MRRFIWRAEEQKLFSWIHTVSWYLTHWYLVTPTFVSQLVIIGSGNVSTPSKLWVLTWCWDIVNWVLRNKFYRYLKNVYLQAKVFQNAGPFGQFAMWKYWGKSSKSTPKRYKYGPIIYCIDFYCDKHAKGCYQSKYRRYFLTSCQFSSTAIGPAIRTVFGTVSEAWGTTPKSIFAKHNLVIDTPIFIV